MLGRQLGKSRFQCAARLLARGLMDGLLGNHRVMRPSRLVTLADNFLELSLTYFELGSELTGTSLLVLCAEPRGGELIIQLPDRALEQRAVGLAILQPLDAARELSLQQLAVCSETLAQASLVVCAVHQFGVSVILCLDGAVRITLTHFAVVKAGFELRKLACRALLVGNESRVCTLQRLENLGALLEERLGAGECRVVLRFSGTRGCQFLS